MIVAGIMTGTSLDAIDVALCEIQPKGDRQTVTLRSFSSAPYPPELAYLIRRALDGAASMEDLSDLPFLLARAYAEAWRAVDPNGTAEAISVHGQTLWHHPPESTWQAVSGPALAALTERTVIHDFRSADVALGGQGAPLVPLFDHAMLGSATEDCVAVNIGGMANVTLLPAGGSIDLLQAFDTGPGNVLINAICERTFGKRFDAKGALARAGNVIPQALEELQTHPFFAQEPPKSTGREVFNEVLVDHLYRRYAHPSIPSEDLVSTLTELTAWSIADHIHRYQPSTSGVFVGGGGVHNHFLMERLAHYLPDAVVRSCADVGIDPDAKEAMCFAWLGWRTQQGLVGNVPSVTGARSAVVLGSVCRTAGTDGG